MKKRVNLLLLLLAATLIQNTSPSFLEVKTLEDMKKEERSYGVIIGGKEGIVWKTIIALKTELQPLSSEMRFKIAKNILSDDTKYTRAQRLNIAFELLADPKFANIKQVLIDFVKKQFPPGEFAEKLGYGSAQTTPWIAALK